MNNRQKLPLFFLLGITAGGIGGLFFAYRNISAQEYLQAGLYRLIAEQLVSTVSLWGAAGGVMLVLTECMRLFTAPLARSLCIALRAGYIVLLCIAAGRCPGSIIVPALVLILLCGLLCLPSGNRLVVRLRSVVSAAALLFLCMLLTIAAWLAADKLQTQTDGPNIVLIVIDCLRPDHLGCYGAARDTSPTIDWLARVGLRFEHAYSNAPWTKPSVTSMLTAMLPARHGVINASQTVPDALVTLAEVLRNSGYMTFFINGGNAFINKDSNLLQGFDKYFYLPHRSTNAAALAGKLLELTGEVGNRRFFSYLHYMDAHAPFTRNKYNTYYAGTVLEPFRPGERSKTFNTIRSLTAQKRFSKKLRQYIRDLYDGQIKFVDESIKQIIGGLQQQGHLANTLFIITADHGEEFWDHANFEHGHTLYNELLHIPLIIAGPGLQPATIATPAQLIDIMPTVLDAAAVPFERPHMQGASLLNPERDRARTVYASGTLYGPETYCVIKNSQKLLYRSKNRQGKWNLIGPQSDCGFELYDLTSDEPERQNLSGTKPLPAELKQMLNGYMNEVPRYDPRGSVIVIGEELRDKLEALGYVQ